ncbi:hypothetical protein F4806DRAFT_324112 [Annulohypoxylon nitens]|nr:hypothetical protein F4806DRAFT_324112 [Annulohypoxylon nitens]
MPVSILDIISRILAAKMFYQRRRKIKCDKSNPCSSCAKADMKCVPIYRKRLPRGRHVHPRSAATTHESDELRERIMRLEALVADLGGTSDTSATDTPSKLGSAALPSCCDVADRIGSGKQFGREFWAHIAEEVGSLRDIVNTSSSDGGSVKSNSKPVTNPGVRFLGIGSTHNDSSGAIDNLLSNTKMTSQLCHIYLRQVDPIIRLLHRPSLSRFMINGQRYLGYDFNHTSATCLSAAVCYVAVASMTDVQCQVMLDMNRSILMAQYRAACEATLERANLINTDDITVLQAFMLYLLARRTEDSARVIWILFAIAVRVAKALLIHLERIESFFNRQLRQRLWNTICLLDIQTSFGQATDTIIGSGGVPSILPMNINDCDFDVDTVGELMGREGLTDMTFALVLYSAQRTGRLLNFHGKGMTDFNWPAREEHVSRFEQNILNLLKFCDPESSSYAWSTFHGAQMRVVAMRLTALRPLHRLSNRPAPQAQNVNLLNSALEVLNKVHLIRTDPRGEGFRWYEVVQWHALAIAIAECFCADSEVLRISWPLVEASYEDYRADLKNYHQGMLRRPLEMLMDTVRARVNTLFSGSTISPQFSEPDTVSLVSFGSNQPAYHSYVQPPNTALDDMDSPDFLGISSTQNLAQRIDPTNFNINSPVSYSNNMFMPSIWEEFVARLPFEDSLQVPT